MKRALPAALLALLVLAMWELLVRLFGVPTFLLPGPTAIAGAFWESRDLLLRHLMERSLYPWLVVSQTLPTVAIAPILVTWFGYGTLPKVLVVTLFCFFPITVATVDGLRATDLELVRLMRSFGASKWRIFFMVEAPGALPFLFGGMRLAVTYCVIGAIVGEWVGSSEGLGFLMIQDKAQFEIPRLFAEISLLSLMGVLLFLLVALLQRLTAPWTLKRDPSL
ncbi:MAG: ABC transporter permease [Actinobacteria bacterium]|nr:ABC transporter permease [Actinomycetota bacterium]